VNYWPFALLMIVQRKVMLFRLIIPKIMVGGRSGSNKRQAPNYRLEPWQRRRLAIEKAAELARKSPKYFNYKLNTFDKK
jgi:hypothetical protein